MGYNNEQIISLITDDGSEIKVKAEIIGGEQDVASVSEIFHFEEVTKTIEKIAKSTKKTINKIKPDKAIVEFGIEIAIEPTGIASALLVKGSGTGNLKIILEWANDKRAAKNKRKPIKK